LVDTCGTGGDGANTFIISTAVAFVSAALGVKIAKHGNRSASGKVGSADVLENLGLPLKVSSEKVVEALKNTGNYISFCPFLASFIGKSCSVEKKLRSKNHF